MKGQAMSLAFLFVELLAMDGTDLHGLICVHP